MEEMPLGLRLSVLRRAFKRQMDERCRHLELTGVQSAVVGTLCRLEREGREEIRQRDLEEELHMAHPTMTDVIQRLEAKGFLSCSPGERDRRVKRISSTQKAADLLRQIREYDSQAARDLCRGLKEEEIASLKALTDRLIENALVAEEPSCCGRKDGTC